MEKKNHNGWLHGWLFIIWLVLTLVCGGLIVRSTLKTQLIDGEMWREKGAQREMEQRVEPACRGAILSSDGKVLATTVPVCDLCLDLGRWPKVDRKGAVVMEHGVRVMESNITDTMAFKANLHKVCKILHESFPNLSEKHFYNRVMNEYRKPKPSRCFYVCRNVPYSQWDSIRHMEGWKRCVVTLTSDGSVTRYVRAHIYGNLGENTVGFYSATQKKGISGLEGYYDSVLRGKDGIYNCIRLTRGVWLPQEDENVPLEDSTLTQRKEDGHTIIATLDTRYQDIAENALRKSMNQYGGKYGCAILMEVSTGYVLACSNLQRDDSGVVSEALWNNVAVSHKYMPGSTNKTVAMLSMLNDRKISLDTTKRVRAGGKKTYSARGGVIDDSHGYNTDTTNLAGVLAKSSNIGMCELAWEYYRNRRNDLRDGMLDIFPYGRLGVDLLEVEPNTGIRKDLRHDRDFLLLSFGYTCETTPMQMITFYNALANDGKMVKPLFCRAILDGNHRSDVKPIVLKERIANPELVKQMREMLVGVVQNGTGSNIKNNVYGIGGKTGTTENIHNRAIKNSSFVGFFPADNPRYTCLVLLEGTSIAGRMAAAPVFKQIADCVVAFDSELGSVHLRDSGRVVNPVATKADLRQLEHAYQLLGLPFSVMDTVQQPTGWALYDNEQQCYRNYPLPTGVVPDCHGMTIRDAMKLLRGMGLKVRFSGQGKVASQTPKARTAIKKGQTVVLELRP
ncbi:MAG: transpeptidase family protein [Bacteroidales bacterium]|nr:transpeptidase family protein [Bacteroidales bacterium]